MATHTLPGGLTPSGSTLLSGIVTFLDRVGGAIMRSQQRRAEREIARALGISADDPPALRRKISRRLARS